MPPKLASSLSSHYSMIAGSAAPAPIPVSHAVAAGTGTYTAAAQTTAVASPALPPEVSAHPLDMALFTAATAGAISGSLSSHLAVVAAGEVVSSSSSSSTAESVNGRFAADNLRMRVNQFDDAVRRMLSGVSKEADAAALAAVHLIDACKAMPFPVPVTDVVKVVNAAYFYAAYMRFTSCECRPDNMMTVYGKFADALAHVKSVIAASDTPYVNPDVLNRYLRVLDVMSRWITQATAVVRPFVPTYLFPNERAVAAAAAVTAVTPEFHDAYIAFLTACEACAKDHSVSSEAVTTLTSAEECLSKAVEANEKCWDPDSFNGGYATKLIGLDRAARPKVQVTRLPDQDDADSSEPDSPEPESASDPETPPGEIERDLEYDKNVRHAATSTFDYTVEPIVSAIAGFPAENTFAQYIPEFLDKARGVRAVATAP